MGVVEGDEAELLGEVEGEHGCGVTCESSRVTSYGAGSAPRVREGLGVR